MEATSRKNTVFAVPDIDGFTPENYFEGTVLLPENIGQLKLLRQQCKENIFYYDWNLSFRNETFASRPDNFGKDEIQIIFNLNQPITWQIDGGRELVEMLPGEVCVFRNNDYETSMSYDKSVLFQFKSMQMTTTYFESLLSAYFPPAWTERCKQLFLTHVTKTAITQDMYRVLSEIDSAGKYLEFQELFVGTKMMELIALVLHGIFHSKTELRARGLHAAPVAAESDVRQLESLRLRIQRNPAGDYRAAELARSLSMSESKLTRLFRSLYGIPVHRYVQEQRLERAAALLAEGGKNISEVALRSGYTNMSHFAKEFQKKFGTTPKKFAAAL